jgi:hypothetical protein
MRATLGLAVVLVLLLASDALAATASVGTSKQFFVGQEAAILYVAAPGERNRVVMAADLATPYPYELVLRDTAAVLTAGPGCVSVDEHTVRCVGPPPAPPSISRQQLSVSIDAGDGDDVVTTPASFLTPVVVTGGDGDDVLGGAGRLAGGAGNDVLTGGDDGPGYKGSGPPSDGLSGGPGDDVLRGGGGDDQLDGGAGSDVIDGGDSNRDTVYYLDRTAGVRVDLADAEAMQGEAGERDTITGVEIAYGGSGDDVLLGTEERNRLEGGAGDDRIIGRGGWDNLVGGDGRDVLDGRDGSDNLYGGEGSDTLRGGTGDDDLQGGGDDDAMDGGPGSDTFVGARPHAPRCGAGHDVVAAPRALLLGADCESVVVGATGFPAYSDTTTVAAQPRRRRGGGLAFGWECDGTADRCDLRVTVRRGGALVGQRAAVLFKRGAAGVIVIRSRRPVRNGQVLDIAISGAIYQATYPGGRTKRFTASWRIRL